MSEADRETLAFYGANAAAYAGYAEKEGRGPWLDRFTARLKRGARVLDLGCGSGWAAARMAAEGFEVDALDASSELVAEARTRYGIDAAVASFDELTAKRVYDGIWASYSLLHDPRDAMPGHLKRIHTALKPEGYFYLGLKGGEGEHRDRLGRFYVHYGRDEIEELLRRAGFDGIETASIHGKDYTGNETLFLHIFASP